MSEELAHVSAELERMKKENEELKKRHALAEEERDLLERQNMEKGDPGCNGLMKSRMRSRWAV